MTALATIVGVLMVLLPSSPDAGNRLSMISGEDIEAAAMLDGQAFDGTIGPLDSESVPDRFVFRNGKFLSRECERRCNYPASAYYVRQVGTRTEFVSETRCPTKDATILWRGVVDGDRIEGVSVWTSRRWYWTIERELAFSGVLETGRENKTARDSLANSE